MELSTQIKKKIKGWEGCRLKTYRCPSNVLTIGYGHTGPDVREGMTITQKRADELFEQDIAKFARSVEPIVRGVALKGCMFDALVSFAYNCGTGTLQKSTLLKLVKADPSDRRIRDEFMKHVNGRVNGQLKRLPGLVNRRMAEADHYFGKI